MGEATSGCCDLCGKTVDAAAEDCHAVECSAGCHRPEREVALYHSECIKKFIATGSRGSRGSVPKIPYSQFPCPTGKGKVFAPPCKGQVLHCKRVIYKREAPPVVAPQALVAPERPRKKDKPPGGAGLAKLAKPSKLAKLAPPTPAPVARPTRLPPVPSAPKPDPLGRNLGGAAAAPRELPPGYSEPDPADAGRGKGKKSQRRAAKRSDAGSTGWEASSNPDSDGAGSSRPASATPAWASDGGAAPDAAAAMAASLGSSGRFITDVSVFNALVALGDSSEVEFSSDSEDDEPSPARPQLPAAGNDPGLQDTGWTTVMGGRAPAPPPAPALARPAPAAPDPSSDAALREREEAELRAALAASAADAQRPAPAPAAAAAAADDDEAAFQAALARALEESRAAQERREREQAALLAAAEAWPGHQAPATEQAWGAPLPPAAGQHYLGPAVAASAAPTPVVATHTALPAAALGVASVAWPPAQAALPWQQAPQAQAQAALPWQAAPAAPAAAPSDGDEDLDELLALLAT